MRLTEMRIAGFGRQGIILSAIVIGKAASICCRLAFDNDDPENAGPEARGGACQCTVNTCGNLPYSLSIVTQPEASHHRDVAEAYGKFIHKLKIVTCS